MCSFLVYLKDHFYITKSLLSYDEVLAMLISPSP